MQARELTVADGSSPLTRGKRAPLTGGSCRGRLIPAHAGKTTRHAPPDSHQQAHPRSRGENTDPLACADGPPGSSPLTRGKPCAPVGQALAPRLIPAHAGKTTKWAVPMNRNTAHPRSRGENNDHDRSSYLREGSSPLTRGKRRYPGLPESRRRLIPAHAGKTDGGAEGLECGEAHPRSRGENRLVEAVSPRFPGSSPLTRGKPVDGVPEVERCRLIPAHAGKTRKCDARLSLTPGSSPLTRGKLRGVVRGGCGLWLIPAHAGKTAPCRGLPAWSAAHPRSRGENDYVPTGATLREGSSPLTRGKPHPHSHATRWRGLIPAHAGKTNSSHMLAHQPQAHPRSRGENWVGCHASPRASGSSPLTRGKLLD